jgi:hypothetical protein
MSDPQATGWDVHDYDEELPAMDTEEARDKWAELLLQQTDESVGEGGWVKALTVTNGEDMVIRLIFPDGSEEVFDCLIRRSIAVVNHSEESDRN